MAGKLWNDLAESTRKRKTRQGITKANHNRYVRASPAFKRKLKQQGITPLQYQKAGSLSKAITGKGSAGPNILAAARSMKKIPSSWYRTPRGGQIYKYTYQTVVKMTVKNTGQVIHRTYTRYSDTELTLDEIVKGIVDDANRDYDIEHVNSITMRAFRDR